VDVITYTEYTSKVSKFSKFCKTLDITNKKSNFDYQIYKNRVGLEMGEIPSRLIHLQTGKNNSFTGEFAFQFCTHPEKFTCLSVKIRAGDVKNSI
jgi:hypothetical protein